MDNSKLNSNNNLLRTSSDDLVIKSMKKYLKYFALVGFLIGFIYGIGLIIYAFYQAPSLPENYEIFIQLLMALALGLLHSFYGFLLWLTCCIAKKLYGKYRR